MSLGRIKFCMGICTILIGWTTLPLEPPSYPSLYRVSVNTESWSQFHLQGDCNEWKRNKNIKKDRKYKQYSIEKD